MKGRPLLGTLVAGLMGGALVVVLTGGPFDAARAQDGATEGVVLTVHHIAATCSTHAMGRVCYERDHWLTSIRERDYADREGELRSFLDGAAAADRKRRGMPAPDPAKISPPSELHVIIKAPETAPMGRVSWVVDSCVDAGIYKIEIGSITSAVKVAPPPARKRRAPKEGPTTAQGQELRILLRLDQGSLKRTRCLNDKDPRPIETEKDLIAAVEAFIEAEEHPCVIIDAAPEVAWGDAIHVLDLLKAKDVETVEFAQHLPPESK